MSECMHTNAERSLSASTPSLRAWRYSANIFSASAHASAMGVLPFPLERNGSPIVNVPVGISVIFRSPLGQLLSGFWFLGLAVVTQKQPLGMAAWVVLVRAAIHVANLRRRVELGQLGRVGARPLNRHFSRWLCWL